MRISDWSSDVCSSDLWQKPKQPPVDPQWPITPKPISLPPLLRLAERTDQLDMGRPAELAHRLYGRQYITCLGQQLGIEGEAARIAGDISDGRNVRLGELLPLLTSSRAGRTQNNSFEEVDRK